MKIEEKLIRAGFVFTILFILCCLYAIIDGRGCEIMPFKFKILLIIGMLLKMIGFGIIGFKINKK